MPDYQINDPEKGKLKYRGTGWCGYRIVVIVGVAISVIIYTIGAIMSGIAYHDMGYGVNCTAAFENENGVRPVRSYGYDVPLVVVGPAFMAAGGAIILMLIFQWCFCRPLTYEFEA